jgi:hypothetical protein
MLFGFQYRGGDGRYFHINNREREFEINNCNEVTVVKFVTLINVMMKNAMFPYHEINAVYTIYNATQQLHTTAQQLNQNQVHPSVIDSPNFPRDTRFKVSLVSRPLLTPLAQSCAGSNMVYSRA